MADAAGGSGRVLDHGKMIARDDPAEPGREGAQRRLRGDELIPIAGDHEQLERRRIGEPFVPIAAQPGNEIAARRHVPQLRPQEREEARLAQTVARCSEQDQVLDAGHEVGFVEQGALYHKPAYAVGHERERLVLRKRRDTQPRA
jgi:hypothetical protein